MKNFKCSFISIIILLILITGFIPGCGSNDNLPGPRSLQPSSEVNGPVPGVNGEPMIFSVSYLDERNNTERLLYEGIYKYYEYDQNGNLIPYQGGDKKVIIILESENTYRGTVRTPGGLKPATFLQVQNFLKDTWMPYEKNMRNKGITEDFITLLSTIGGGDLDIFLGLYNQSGMTIEEYIAFLKTLSGLLEKSNNNLGDFASFLKIIGMKLSEFKGSLNKQGMTAEEFLNKVKEEGYDIPELTELYIKGKWKDGASFLSSINSKEGPFEGMYIATGFTVLPIVANSDTTVGKNYYTYLLSGRDRDPSHYDKGSHSSNSKEIKLEMRGLVGYTYKIQATYDCKNNNVPGTYITQIKASSERKYQYGLWRNDAKLNLAAVYNAGGTYDNTANPPNAGAITLLNVTFEQYFIAIWYKHIKEILFEIDGKSGVQDPYLEDSPI